MVFNFTTDTYLNKLEERINLFMKEDIPFSRLDTNGMAIIHQLAYIGKLDLLKKVLVFQANIHELDHEQKNSLHYAIKGNQSLVLKYLLKQDIFYNQKDKSGETPLIWATKLKNYEAVKILIKHGVNPYLKNKNGENALMIASKDEDLELVSLILESYTLKENYIKHVFDEVQYLQLNYRPMSKHLMNGMNTNDIDQLSYNLFHNNKKKFKSIINTHIFNTEKGFINYGLLNLCSLFFKNFLNYNLIIDFILDNPVHLKNVFFNDEIFNKLGLLIKQLKNIYPDQRIIHLFKDINEASNLEYLDQSCDIYFILQKENVDFSIIFPKKPKNIYDIYASLLNYSEKRIQSDFNLNQYEISKIDNKKIERFVIKIPKKNYELIDASSILNICIGDGSYSNQIKNKECFVFFLYYENKLKYCVQMQGNNIIQARGFNNEKLHSCFTYELESYINDILND